MAAPNTTGATLGEYGTEQYVPTNALKVDPSYQRPTNANRVKKIAEAFDPDLAGRLVVNTRADGQYFVVDGQHRLAAMRIRKIALIPCIVYEGWTPEREADVFRTLNTAIKHPTHYERHRAGMRAGHKDSVEIDQIIRDAGCQMSERHPRGGSRMHVAAINTCYSIYHSKFGGPELLRRTFNILSDVFGEDDHAFDGDMIIGLAYFLWRADREENFREEHLREVLSLVTPSDIIRKANGWLEVAKVRYGSFSLVVHDLYNKGKRTKKLGSWTDVEWSRTATGVANSASLWKQPTSSQHSPS